MMLLVVIAAVFCAANAAFPCQAPAELTDIAVNIGIFQLYIDFIGWITPTSTRRRTGDRLYTQQGTVRTRNPTSSRP